MESIEYIEKLYELKATNVKLLDSCEHGSLAWRHHEKIDDELHELLTIMGE